MTSPIAPSLPRPARPRWPLVVFVVYVLLLLAAYAVPLIYMATQSADLATWLAITLLGAAVLTGQLGLLFIPIEALRRRPLTRRSWLVPLVGSGLLMSLLVLGAFWSAYFAYFGDEGRGPIRSDAQFMAVIILCALCWLPWTLLFARLARRKPLDALTRRLQKILIASSILELCIAVPSHIIVRRRGDCCAPYFTGTAIILGALISLIAFGPAVIMLYLKRCRDISPGSDTRTYGFEVVPNPQTPPSKPR